MEMAGERRIAAPRQKVWEALNDPAVLGASIPGCQSLEKEGDDKFNAVAEIKIGPIGARFKGAVALSDLDAPNGYTISGQGNGGVAGNAKGSARVRLSDDGAGTIIKYDVDAQVGGRMAQLGGPLIDATAKQMADKFFTRFAEIVGGEAAPAVVAPAAAPAESAAVAGAAAPVSGYVAPVKAAGDGFPWSWAIAVALAIIAGFLLGRSGAADWWVVAVVVLAIGAAGAGFDAGRKAGGGR